MRAPGRPPAIKQAARHQAGQRPGVAPEAVTEASVSARQATDAAPGRPAARGGPRSGNGSRCECQAGPPPSSRPPAIKQATRHRPPASHEKVTGTCHSERSEESEVGHAARLVRPDASLPLSMTREGAFFTAWGGPTIYEALYEAFVPLVERSYSRATPCGWPAWRSHRLPLPLLGPPLAGGLLRPRTGFR